MDGFELFTRALDFTFFEGQRGGGGVPHLENYIRPETAEWIEFTHVYIIQSSILMLQVDSKKRKREGYFLLPPIIRSSLEPAW